MASIPCDTFPPEAGANRCASLTRRPYQRDRVRRADRVRRRRRRSRSRRPGGSNKGSDAEEAAEFHPHHARDVPREVDLSSVNPTDSSGAASQDVTTMMLKHIPCRYTQGTLLREIDVLGFEGTYDFFYLPMDVRNKTSVGYCFINFLASSDASRFAEVFGAYEFQRHRSAKIGEVSPAKIQGLRGNMDHFSGRAVVGARDGNRRPIVLQNGFRRDFGEVLAELSNSSQASQKPVAAALNPMAEEFVPSFGPALNPDAPEFVPGMPATAAPGAGSDDAFQGARSGLEEAVRRLLERAAPAPLPEADVEPTSRAQVLQPSDGDSRPAVGGASAQSYTPETKRSSWVADAFEHLVDDLAGASKDGSAGGSWMYEALMSLASGGYVGRRPCGPEQSWREPPSADGGWVADAFKALIASAAKNPAAKILAEDLAPTPTALTPRLGDTVQRLRSFGGWAWVAFA